MIETDTTIPSDNNVNTMPKTNPIEKNEETPVKILRERLNITSREYNELLEFTRLEKFSELSVEQDMAQKLKALTQECSVLRASLEYAETKNQALILEQEKSRQLIKDYEDMIDSQKLREKLENELKRKEHSMTHTKSKSLDSSVLHMLLELQSILDPKPNEIMESSNPSSSCEQSFNLFKVARETEQILSSDSKNIAFSIDLEKLKSFSNGYFKDSESSTEFMNYFQSVLAENSTLSQENARLKTSLQLQKGNDPSNEIEKLKNEISSIKMEWKSDRTKISNLQKQLEEYKFRNLSDSEKLNSFVITIEKKDIEKKEIEIQKLTSELHKVVSDKNSTLKLIKKLEIKNLEIEELINTFVEQQDIINSNVEIVKKMYVEISRLKELVVPDDGPKGPTTRQFLFDHRAMSTDMMKLEEIKYLVDVVCSLVQERNLLKHQNEDENEILKNHDKMKREFDVKKRQYDLIIADLNALKNEHMKVRENYETSKSEVEQLKSSLKKIKSMHEICESKIENLSFENRDLSKKLSERESICREFEILKYKYEQLKITQQSGEGQNPEIKSTTICKDEDKWKQQRKKTHDSRRSIDLDTLCLESVVDTCNNCENMSQKLQKTKSEMLQLRKYIESMSTSEFEILKCKYEKLKKLCRMRNDEITKLKQSMLEMK